MKIVVVAVAIVSACFMQEVSGRFLSRTPQSDKKTPAKVGHPKIHMTEEKEHAKYTDIIRAIKNFAKDLTKLSDKLDLAAKDGASDEAKKAAAQAKKDFKEAEESDTKALAKVGNSKIHMTEEREGKHDAPLSQAQDLTKKVKAGEMGAKFTDIVREIKYFERDLTKLSARAEELNKVAAKDGASDEAKKAAAQANKDFKEAEYWATWASGGGDSDEPPQGMKTDRLKALFDELNKADATDEAPEKLLKAAAQEAVKNLEKADEQALAKEANKAGAQAQAPAPQVQAQLAKNAGAGRAQTQHSEANAGELDNKADDEADDEEDNDDEEDSGADDDYESDDAEEDDY